MNTWVGVKEELLLSRIGADELARLVMTLLTTARRIDAACAELLAGHDLSEGRLAALLAVGAEPGITPGLLADRLDVTRATITGLLDGLERRGLVARDGKAGDRRSLALHVTAPGEQLVATLTPIYADWLRQLGGGISAENREVAARTMIAIQRNLRSGDEG